MDKIAVMSVPCTNGGKLNQCLVDKLCYCPVVLMVVGVGRAIDDSGSEFQDKVLDISKDRVTPVGSAHVVSKVISFGNLRNVCVFTKI